MSNRIPVSYNPIVQLLEDAADSAHLHGTAVGLKQNTETAIRADLEQLVGKPAGPDGNPAAIPGVKALWNEAKAQKSNNVAALRTANSNGRAQLMISIDVLKPRLGNQWNSQWQAAGFVNASLAVPDSPMTELQQLRAYFELNPTHEAPSLAPLPVTAAACNAAAQAISNAMEAANKSNSKSGTAKKNYENGLAAARTRLSGLRTELEQLLDDDDPLWYAFGFDRPSDPETPEVVAGLTVIAGAPGSRMVFADWDDARRAENYRVTVTNAADGSPVTEAIVPESEGMLQNLPQGMSVKIAVSARNVAGGESRACEPVTITVP